MWRYIATRLNGDGTETPLDWHLPLSSVQPTEELNAPDAITATITPEYEHLEGADGLPIFLPKRTAVYAQKDDNPDLIGAIFHRWTATGPSLQLSAVGFAEYPSGQPYVHTMAGRVGVDPAVAAKEIWDYVQGLPGGDHGVVVDALTSNRRIGKTAAAGTTNPDEYQNSPYQLGWWKTPDLGKVFEDLRAYTPFDYRMKHTLEADGTITHRMVRAAKIGRRQDMLRFAVGENVLTEPALESDGEDYVTTVLVLGAGEGEKRRRGSYTVPGSTVRRAIVVEDTSLDSNEACTRRAIMEARVRNGAVNLAQLVVTDHPNAGLGTFDVGDEILLTAGPGWGTGAAMWLRVWAISYNTETDEMTLETTRI